MQGSDFVLHAAALKQVPTAEYNPTEYIKTNIYGAQNLIEACLDSNVKKVIALSTDKASSPINLYGATKLCSDKLFIAANQLTGSNKLSFSIVRYGNVMGSRGSVIPFFIDQSNKGILTITDKRMTRFWITLSQSAELVLNSFYRMSGGEIFVPKIPSIKITDLAKAISPSKKIKFIGIRPGEKISEILCSRDESINTVEFKDYYLLKPSIKFIDQTINYLVNIDKEKGKLVSKDFEYSSSNNKKFLSLAQIKNYIDNEFK